MNDKKMRVVFNFKTKFYYIQCFNGTHWNDIISYKSAEGDMYDFVDSRIITDLAKMISQGYIFDTNEVVALNV